MDPHSFLNRDSGIGKGGSTFGCKKQSGVAGKSTAKRGYMQMTQSRRNQQKVI
jgi:hypothetical protein